MYALGMNSPKTLYQNVIFLKGFRLVIGNAITVFLRSPSISVSLHVSLSPSLHYSHTLSLPRTVHFHCHIRCSREKAEIQFAQFHQVFRCLVLLQERENLSVFVSLPLFLQYEVTSIATVFCPRPDLILAKTLHLHCTNRNVSASSKNNTRLRGAQC